MHDICTGPFGFHSIWWEVRCDTDATLAYPSSTSTFSTLHTFSFLFIFYLPLLHSPLVPSHSLPFSPLCIPLPDLSLSFPLLFFSTSTLLPLFFLLFHFFPCHSFFTLLWTSHPFFLPFSPFFCPSPVFNLFHAIPYSFHFPPYSISSLLPFFPSSNPSASYPSLSFPLIFLFSFKFILSFCSPSIYFHLTLSYTLLPHSFHSAFSPTSMFLSHLYLSFHSHFSSPLQASSPFPRTYSIVSSLSSSLSYALPANFLLAILHHLICASAAIHIFVLHFSFLTSSSPIPIFSSFSIPLHYLPFHFPLHWHPFLYPPFNYVPNSSFFHLLHSFSISTHPLVSLLS